MTTLKTVEDAVEEYCGDWQLGKSIHDNTVRAITQDRQATADVLCGLLEGKKAPTPPGISKSPEANIGIGSYNQALTHAQDIIRATLSNKN